ncbi:hypothetical protein SAMN04488037_10982 [Shimia marina]|uniref:Uncharacterized protein n=2 Tax=Shimia marina TaxID=321267 RepID=A0A0P1ENW5_9RHOB|nr:hypothetical protein SHM7688_01395 [Shimia marina]SFE44691.1 hypothetical protein SAMN04488037_10982 [Shimia marina]
MDKHTLFAVTALGVLALSVIFWGWLCLGIYKRGLRRALAIGSIQISVVISLCSLARGAPGEALLNLFVPLPAAYFIMADASKFTHFISHFAIVSFVGNEIQSWDITITRFEELGIQPVKTLYRGPYRANLFEDMAKKLNTDTQEGFVARISNSFSEADIPYCMGKYVRANHVQSDIHWSKADLLPNGLKT